jgi:Flp pilus assembly protein TadD
VARPNGARALFDGDYPAAVSEARKALHLSPNLRPAHITLIAALGQLGLLDEARAAMADALGRFGEEFRSRMAAAASEILYWLPEDREHLIAGWRKAGLLEK